VESPVNYGYKGKGMLLHLLADKNGSLKIEELKAMKKRKP